MAGSEPEGHWQPPTYRTLCQNIAISEHRETIQAEYQPSKRIEDHEAGAIGGAGQWPTHPPAGRTGGAGAYNIALRHPYIPILQARFLSYRLFFYDIGFDIVWQEKWIWSVLILVNDIFCYIVGHFFRYRSFDLRYRRMARRVF